MYRNGAGMRHHFYTKASRDSMPRTLWRTGNLARAHCAHLAPRTAPLFAFSELTWLFAGDAVAVPIEV